MPTRTPSGSPTDANTRPKADTSASGAFTKSLDSARDSTRGSNDAEPIAPSTRVSGQPAHSLSAGLRPARPGKESLREQKKAKARELILNCAQQLINTDGYTETKMRDVATAASMSYQTLYNYFPTKGLILQELLTRDLVKLRRGTFDTLQNSEPLTTKLRDVAKSYIDAIAPDERHLWKEVCAELLKATSHHSCLLALLDEQALNKLRNLLASAQTNNELDPHIDSDTLAGVLYSLLDATLMRYLVNESLSRPNILSAISTQIRFLIGPYRR